MAGSLDWEEEVQVGKQVFACLRLVVDWPLGALCVGLDLGRGLENK